MEEKSGAMLVVCVRGKEIQKIQLDKDWYSIGNLKKEQSTFKANKESGEKLEVASSLVDAVNFFIEKDEKEYTIRVIGGAEHIWHNGTVLGKAGEDVQVQKTLGNHDVLKIDSPEFGTTHEEAVTLIYHSHYRETTQWKNVSLLNGKDKLYISRHEALAEGGEEVVEDLAELPPNRYAVMVHDEGGWNVEDHNTMYGVYVNHVKIQARKKLYPMDVVSIGNTLFVYQPECVIYNHVESAKNSLVIHIEERSVWNLFRKQVLLEDIGLSIEPGEMVLILGGSGAGKTTFINAVMGYEKAKGKIMEGDIDIYENYNRMKYDIGFVPQQDLVRMEDRVYDTIQNAADLKMPKATTKEEKAARIEEVLKLFGLEREQQSLIGKLSGGQRKRLSIAMEFVADPSLFFLDEPDSGLDGIMARSLMEDLRDIADKDKIVLIITHAPDRAADLFDKVIVLAKSTKDNVGHMAFYGTVEESYDFFGVKSLEQVVRRINREDEGGEGKADEYIEKYKQLEGK